jgi:hypothetical protein
VEVGRLLAGLLAVLHSLRVVVHRLGAGADAGEVDQAALVDHGPGDVAALERADVLLEGAQIDTQPLDTPIHVEIPA